MSSWLGGLLLQVGEWIIKKLPIVKHIYSAAKQVSALPCLSIHVLPSNLLTPYAPHHGQKCRSEWELPPRLSAASSRACRL